MKLARYVSSTGKPAVGLVEGASVRALDLAGGPASLAGILEADDPQTLVHGLVAQKTPGTPLARISLLPPVDAQEIWAAGVTYKRSQSARMEESEAAASCYDRVYGAERPELFFKSTPHRVAGHGQPLRIRADSAWNVPEPELTLVLDSRLRRIGFTIGNDMSSRDIEGENPLYLPQAKIYNQSAGIGPWILVRDTLPSREGTRVRLVIRRRDSVAFEGGTSVGQMVRRLEDLVDWLGRDNSFPNGVMLMTGTGIVPDGDFTLQTGDVVDITVDGIGTLSNPIVQG